MRLSFPNRVSIADLNASLPLTYLNMYYEEGSSYALRNFLSWLDFHMFRKWDRPQDLVLMCLPLTILPFCCRTRLSLLYMWLLEYRTKGHSSVNSSYNGRAFFLLFWKKNRNKRYEKRKTYRVQVIAGCTFSGSPEIGISSLPLAKGRLLRPLPRLLV